ncbi:M protein, serotype 5-like [Montipora capricornis]|uniref:M protein, serotype 5-like n=1 Tax=Montipora foliosa TaxID=591990 RepID=UPI0035F10EEB
MLGIELDNIKQRVENELNVQNNQTSCVADGVVVKETNNRHGEPFEEEVEPSQNSSEINDLVNEIKKARAEWENIRMAERPPLPKISMNRKTELLITQGNQAIQLIIAEEVLNLNNINLLQYVTAYVISEKLGKTTKLTKTKSNKRQLQKWKAKMENQINSMRADLSILTDMAQKGETQKISKKKQRIKKKYKITTNQELQAARESLKMRIQAKPDVCKEQKKVLQKPW